MERRAQALCLAALRLARAIGIVPGVGVEVRPALALGNETLEEQGGGHFAGGTVLHWAGGAQEYPADGAKALPVQLNTEYTLRIEARVTDSSGREVAGSTVASSVAGRVTENAPSVNVTLTRPARTTSPSASINCREFGMISTTPSAGWSSNVL